ncbi:hypothetical protein C3R43_15710 [Serratia marcescens]|nr:hypothetical protein C3R39_10480 [Serratia marcescens]POP25466.1 hypothetical protein C3R43_15710 [Serratia marcescens]
MRLALLFLQGKFQTVHITSYGLLIKITLLMSGITLMGLRLKLIKAIHQVNLLASLAIRLVIFQTS